MARTFKSSAELFADLGKSVLSRRTPEGSRVQTVSELSEAISCVIKEAPELSNIAVRGEVKDLKRHTSGHVYFTLTDPDSSIRAVMFRSRAASVISWPRDGDEVVVIGSVGVYTKGGSCQVYATGIMPLGQGAQARAREELRLRLDAEGIFDPRHKRPIPKYPRKVAVITSPTGAAIQDILEVSEKRADFIDIFVVPTLVQGVDAPAQIARAFCIVAESYEERGLDCVILARGGGAKDDLSPFDEERVVRAMRSCPIPVVTGIGHQIDTSLADLAADLPRPTPSAAAEAVFPEKSEILAILDASMASMVSEMVHAIDRASDELRWSFEKLGSSIDDMIARSEEIIDRSRALIEKEIQDRVARAEDALAALAARLDSLSPLAVLARGFAICKDDSGELICSVESISCGDRMTVTFKDGDANVSVVDKDPHAVPR